LVFTDEDFFSDNLFDLDRITSFTNLIIESKLKIKYYFASRVTSIYSKNDDEKDIQKKKNIFKLLKVSGLDSIFLGIESGSISQLNRYSKGYKPFESKKAIDFLLNLDIKLDIGFIMFDPLMDISEILENIQFIKDSNILGLISVLPHEIRIQENTAILQKIRNYEKKSGDKILGDFDLNTLNYPIISYKNKNVEKIAKLSFRWQEKYYEFWYALKGRIRSMSQNKKRRQLMSFYKKFQELELEFIEFIAKNKVNNLNIIKFEEIRMSLIHEINSFIIKNKELDLNNTIAKGINLYLTRM